MIERERPLLPGTELSRPALVLAQCFVQRWDLYARQLDDGSYVCVHEPLNVGHLLAYLQGKITLGAYLLDQESRARYLVLVELYPKQGQLADGPGSLIRMPFGVHRLTGAAVWILHLGRLAFGTIYT